MLDNCVAELLAEEEFCREVRRVSWRPGAEGAPRGRVAFEVVLVVLVAWEEGGAMRRDCMW